MTAITDLGLVSSSSATQLHQVHVQRGFPAAQDPNGTLAGWCVTDYFLDPQTNLVVQVIDQTHAVGDPTQSFPHEIDLGKYTPVNGLAVPMTVTEKIEGQTIWQLQLASVTFNAGLTDADFTLQQQ